VVFDDGDAIVKTVQFEQPTAWLVAQMQREARPWQTWWAIEQLRQHAAHDSVAAASLVTAALHGRYALTRAQAMVALGTVETPASVAALTQGVQDTAVIVRRGAVEGLGTIGTWGALEVERSVFAHDQSDLVRADALQILLMAPTISPLERQALFAQALLQETYDDVIPVIAIKAMAVTSCDTLTVATLHEALGHPHVAAALAAADPILESHAPRCRAILAAQLHQPISAH
jgi:HEAT repeat protein